MRSQGIPRTDRSPVSFSLIPPGASGPGLCAGAQCREQAGKRGNHHKEEGGPNVSERIERLYLEQELLYEPSAENGSNDARDQSQPTRMKPRFIINPIVSVPVAPRAMRMPNSKMCWVTQKASTP